MKKAVFIHSLFRTGSTYIWNCFRKKHPFYCYYEPFHQSLCHMTLENAGQILTHNYEAVHHPHLDRHYFYEYKPLLTEQHCSLRFFKKAFSFDLFCEVGPNKDVKAYVDFLIDNTPDSMTPLLQFNRTALRVAWFKANYPKSLNIYLIRHPRDQFQSQYLFAKGGQPVFEIMDLLASGVNASQPVFHKLASQVPLVEFHDSEYGTEERFYDLLRPSYSLEEKYLIFYYIWLSALLANLNHADLLINMNRFSREPNYRDKVGTFFRKDGFPWPDFSDASLLEYDTRCLNDEAFEAVEELVQSLIIPSTLPEYVSPCSRQDAEGALNSLAVATEFLPSHQFCSTNHTIVSPTLVERYSKIVDKLFRQCFAQENDQNNLETELRQKHEIINTLKSTIKSQQDMVNKLETQISSLNQSTEYKLGRLLMKPIKHIRSRSS